MPAQSEGMIPQLVTQAVRMGADELEVEYKDRHEEVFAGSGGLLFGIARFPSSSAEATRLRKELSGLQKRKPTITVDGYDYQLRCTVYDSFGEDAFRLELRSLERRNSSQLRQASRK
ncbi:MAG: hypothetical protein ACR2IK_05380 [Chloroflexota bacterium]